MKRLPPEMRDWYFQFNWDLSKLWNLDVPTTTLPLFDLEWHFDVPIWSKEKGMHFDLCPREVIQNPGHHPRHDTRIEKTDISHPIDMMFTVDRLAIIDGVHRLAKYEINGIDDVRVRIIPREMIPLFAEKTEGTTSAFTLSPPPAAQSEAYRSTTAVPTSTIRSEKGIINHVHKT